MAKTQADVAVDATQEIAQNTWLEGAEVDVADYFSCTLAIWWALTNETAHTGTKAIIEWSPDDAGDEDWHELTQVVFGVGKTNLEAITNNPLAVGDGPVNAITVASLTGYTVGSWVFLEDATFANSEWLRVSATSVEAGDDHIHTFDGVTRQHANTAVLNSVAGCVTPIAIPDTAHRIRVMYDNTYDSDGATVAIKSQLGTATY